MMKNSDLCYAIWSWGVNKEQLELAAKDISQIGYKSFETTKQAIYAYDFNIDEYKTMLDRYSLKAESFYFVLPEKGNESPFFNALEKELEFIAQVGVKRATLQAVWGRPQNDIMDEASKRYNLNLICKFANIAKNFGIKTSIHPHINTYCMYEDEINFIMDNTRSDLIGLAPDTAHISAAGADPIKIMEKYATRINFTHLKDYKLGNKNALKSWVGSNLPILDCFCELGKGVLNFPKIIKILESANYDGPLCIELDRSLTSNAASAKLSFNYLSKLL